MAFVGNGIVATSTGRARAACTTAVRASSRPARAWRRQQVRAMAEEGPSAGTSTSPPPAVGEEESVVQKFVTQAEEKLEEFKGQVTTAVEEFDAEDFKDGAVAGSKSLLENFLAGDWLTRGESYGGVQVLFAVFLLQDSTMLDALANIMFGPVTLVAGALISIKGLADLGIGQLSLWPRPVPNSTLKTEGLFSLVRHPVYSGVLLSSLGWSSCTDSPARFALTLAFAYFLSKKIDAEEAYLSEAFEEYEDYKANVPNKLIPKIY